MQEMLVYTYFINNYVTARILKVPELPIIHTAEHGYTYTSIL